MRTPRTPPHLATLVCLTAVSTLSLNMFLPSLANIATDLKADYATVSLAVAGYLAVTAVIQLIAGPLSDRIGRRPVMLGAVLLFTMASVGCVLAETVWGFLAWRMVQGGIICGYALSLAIVRDTHGDREAAGLIGYIGMAMAVAPMLGPMLGGVLDAAFGWRATFQVLSLVGVALFVLCWVDLGETRPARKPIADARPGRPLVAEPLYLAHALCAAFSTGAFYIFLTGAPLVAQADFGLSTAELGVFIGSITAGFMFGGFLAGRFAPRLELTTTMLIGRIVACSGLALGLVACSQTEPTPLLFFGGTLCVGLGNGITMPASNTGAMSVRPDRAGTAAGLTGALIVALGAGLTTLTGLLLPAQGAAVPLLLLMLAASGVGLVCTLWAIRLRTSAPHTA